MTNPYEEFKNQHIKQTYVCNKCKQELTEVFADEKEKGMEKIMGALGGGYKAKPFAFYCTNKFCNHYGLLTKVAIKK